MRSYDKMEEHDIFRKLDTEVESKSVLKDELPLTETYLPKRPLYREDHIVTLTKYILFYLKTNSSGVILLEGPAGTGKTMCFRFVEKYLRTRMAENKVPRAELIYIRGVGKSVIDVVKDILL